MAASPHNTFGFASVPHSSHHSPGFLQPVINQIALSIQGERSELYWKCFFICVLLVLTRKGLSDGPSVLFFVSSGNVAAGDSFLQALTALGLETALSPCWLSWQNNDKKSPFTFFSNPSTLPLSAEASSFCKLSFWSLALLMWWSSWHMLSIFPTWHTCSLESFSLQNWKINGSKWVLFILLADLCFIFTWGQTKRPSLSGLYATQSGV